MRARTVVASVLLLPITLALWSAASPALAGGEPARAGKSAAAPAFVWGVNGHPLTAYKGVGVAAQLDHVQKLGLTSYRVDVLDERAVPLLRDLAREGKKRGIAILPVITPNLSFTLSSPAELYKRAFDRARATIAPLKDDIRVWELGNEIENYAIIKACEMRDDGRQYNCSWGPAGGVDPLDYYGPRWAKASAVLKGLSDGARAADPTVRRAIGTAGWGHTGAFERMRADGVEWDISVWHIYGQDPEWAFKILAGYGKPIWVTEFNHPGGSSESAEAQAQGLARMMQRIKELSGTYSVEAAHVYELYDEPYWAPSFEAHMGLVTLERSGDETWRPGREKLAFEAVRDGVAGRFRAAAADTLPKRNCTLPDPPGAAPQPAGGATPTRAAVATRTVEVATHAAGVLPRDAGAGDAALPPRIAYAYCLILGREPDGDGMRAWSDALSRRLGPAEMLEAMVHSPEFGTRHRTDALKNVEFVALLYRMLLMREPDGGGLAMYATALDEARTDRVGVVRDILASHEFAVRHPILALPATPPSHTR